jgi:hypothetical protein
VSPLSLLLFLLGGAGVLLSVHLYLRVEVPVRGRASLLALRVAVLGLLTLLLVNPTVPGAAPEAPAREGASWVLVDPDLSLAARGDDEAPLWQRVLDRAGEGESAGALLAVPAPGGAGPEGVDLTTLEARGPSHPPGDLLEAVRGLAEAGADTVRILSTFRRPGAFLETLGASAPVPLRLERIGGPVRNAAVAELVLPESVREGEELEGRVSLVHENAAPGDSARIEIRAQGGLVRTLAVPLAAGSGWTELPLALPAPADTGQLRYTARVVLAGDAFPADDERVRRVRVGASEEGILLVSLRPDWEPRTLLPVLTAVTGLPGEGFLQVGDRLFLPLVEGEGASQPLTGEDLGPRMARARLLVVHGVGDEVPGWLESAVRDHPRVLHLAAGPGGAALARLDVGPPLSGEWTLEPEPPPGPLAPWLRDVALGALPPLTAVMPRVGDPGAGERAALRARGPAREDPVPVLLLLERDEGRTVVSLASGFWRWGTRTGDARRAYRGLWAGTADWLLASPGDAPEAGIRPASPVQARGRPLEWIVPPGLEGGHLTLTTGEAEPLQAGLAPDDRGRARTPSLDPGTYRYRAVALRSVSGDEVTTEGEVEVEGWAPSLLLPPLDVPGELPAARATLGMGEGGDGGRPLRTFALPWVLLVLLLCGEWIGRRRVGLR